MRSLLQKGIRYGWVTAVIACVLIALLPVLGIGSTDFHRQLMLASIYGLLVVGFNLGFGYGGQLALGQVAVFAGGAYVAAIMFNNGVNDLALQILVAVAFAAFIGIMTGLPGLRLSHFALALVAFFLILLIGPLTNAFEADTGGVLGLPGILDPKIFGIQLTQTSFYVVTVVGSFLGLFLFRNLVVSRFGHSMIILKQGPALARSLGISPFRIRMSAYVLGALPAGLAGVFFAYYSTYVIATSFQFTVVILLLAASIVGGTRSIWGAPVACAILIILPDSAATFEQYSVLIYGVIITLAGLGLAAGIGGLSTNLVRRMAGAPTGVVSSGAEDILADEELDEDAPKKAAAADTLLSMTGQTLVATNVKKSFGGVEALRGVDLEAKPGLVTAIIGANGAGKTTLLNAVSGLIAPDQGEVKLDEAIISGLQPNEIARVGVARTFQTPQIPEALTVLDVAASGRYRRHWIPSGAIAFRLPIYNKVTREDYRLGLEALKFVGLEEFAHLPATALPLGRRRILEVARAIAAEPAVILLDEPAAGLDPDGLQLLHELLARLRDAGATVVLIEHNVTFVMNIADRVVVMDVGSVIATGTPDEVRRDERVIASYLGRRHSDHATADQAEPTKQGAEEVEDVV